MIFKRVLSAFCALAICAGMADAKPVGCKSASGILDPLGYKLELNIVCNADGYYAGNFTFDEKTYIAFGRTYDVDDPEISLQLFENGCLVGDLNVMYEEDMDRCAFYLSGTGVNGYGSVQNFNTESWTVVPYKDGKITFKDAYDDTFVIEFYKDFIIAKCLEAEAVEDYESDAAFASGVFPDDAEDIDSMKLPREGKTIEFLKLGKGKK